MLRGSYTAFVISIFWICFGLKSIALPANNFDQATVYENLLFNILGYGVTFLDIENSHPLRMQEKDFAQHPFAEFRVSSSTADSSEPINSAGVRELQLQLKRLGCYRGVTDGKIGPQTRAAFMRFSRLSGADLALEGIRTATAMDAVSVEKNLICGASWLLKNRPEELLGKWGFHADCPNLFVGIQITGELDLRKATTERFVGLATNSLGMSGKIEGQVSGQSVDTIIDWPGFRISVSLIASNQKMSLNGVSSNGCDIVAWKSASLE